MTSLGSKRNQNIHVDPTLRLTQTIVFVGLMGAGKTNIGRRVATSLNISFFDSDHEVEEAAGMHVSDIFEIHGEAAFRDTERKVLKRLLAGPVCIIATGGGAFMNDETRHTISESAKSIWLRAPLDILVERTSKSNRRPLLQKGDPRKILQDLIEKRYPIYEKADIIVESDERPPNVTTELTIQALLKAGIIQKNESAQFTPGQN